MAGALSMKFNPYPVLLTTAALMFATVVFAQTGHSAALVKAGAGPGCDACAASLTEFSEAPNPDIAPLH